MDANQRERAKELRRNQTKAESLLWQALRSKQLCGLKFRRQHPVGRYFADFACLAKRLVVELDGGYHDQTESYDAEREGILQASGWEVIRFPNEEVLESVEAVLQAIAAAANEPFDYEKRNSLPSGCLSANKPSNRKSERSK